LYMLPLIVSAPEYLSVVRYDPVEIAVEVVLAREESSP
jgi:hypothetical protein